MKNPIVRYLQIHDKNEGVEDIYLIDQNREQIDSRFTNLKGLGFSEKEIGETGGKLLARWWANRRGGGDPALRVGFIGGANVPVIARWASGFASGARSILPSTHFESRCLGFEPSRFDDKWSAYHMTCYLIQALKVDVVIQASGASCVGVIDAVREFRSGERELFLICCDYGDWSKFEGLQTKLLFSATRSIEREIVRHTAFKDERAQLHPLGGHYMIIRGIGALDFPRSSPIPRHTLSKN